MWFISALLTAVAWGICYVCAEQLLKSIDKTVYLAISHAVNCSFWICCLLSRSDLKFQLYACRWWLLAAIVSSILGNYLSIKAIELKNATYASVVEISYPIWCALFTYLILGYNPLNWKSGFAILLIVVGLVLFVVSSEA